MFATRRPVLEFGQNILVVSKGSLFKQIYFNVKLLGGPRVGQNTILALNRMEVRGFLLSQAVYSSIKHKPNQLLF